MKIVHLLKRAREYKMLIGNEGQLNINDYISNDIIDYKMLILASSKEYTIVFHGTFLGIATKVGLFLCDSRIN